MIGKNRKECIAMLLAGGRGARLLALTDHIAKPAVTFGGKYRIIDFTLSNCVHSGIDTVGVLTQYQPHFLHGYIGKGQSWDLDRMFGGVAILPPFSSAGGSDWYSGTANSVYQNRQFIYSYDPKYVMVLSGDHVYKMDYAQMLKFHKDNQADCTIAVIKVPPRDASRYGILNTDTQQRIISFEEKPREPKSNKASMGVYIFNWPVLREYLENDARDTSSDNDFGKNIIPNMLADGRPMYAYRFKGYWKDVGTVESLWEANMDMLEDMTLGLLDWPILSQVVGKPPQYIAKKGKVKNSLLNAGCEIYGSVEHSILSEGVIVEQGAVVRDAIVMANTVIKRYASVNYAILDEDSYIGKNAVVGAPREEGGPITVVGRREESL
ncbi:MAG: glucose-1-phosphate adenylyltransferase [Peptococcaceae bacterium]|jgi:glucose-1-phosphate adenylyltransferase|nr:glucose-1-phosphate adenylyltransferase [Peptococcaceae bacterium]